MNKLRHLLLFFSLTAIALFQPGNLHVQAAATRSDNPSFRRQTTACSDYKMTYSPGYELVINDGETVNSFLDIPVSMTIQDIDVRIWRLDHSYSGDLNIYLIDPDLNEIELSIGNGSDANYIETFFDNEAATSISTGTAPFTGSFQPGGDLTSLYGRDLNGMWILRITDTAAGDTGALFEWGLYVCGEPADHSDLPASYGEAWHTGSGELRIGTQWTEDASFAFGADDKTDDGIAFPGEFRAGWDATMTIYVSGAELDGGWLQVWFDWNQNGSFDVTELVYNQEADRDENENSFTIPVPAGLSQAVNYRVRLYYSAPSGSSAFGAAIGGEVTDGLSPVPVTTAVDVFNVEAQAAGGAVRISWEANPAADVLGFYVLRAESEQGEYVRLNASILPNTTTSYAWYDASAQAGMTYYYQLEMVGADGVSSSPAQCWSRLLPRTACTCRSSSSEIPASS